MKVLVTGFEPFGGEKINPSYEVIKSLPDLICEAEIYKTQIPTVFNKSVNVLIKKIEKVKPDIVIMIGQAGGRHNITVERIAINVNDARIEDNEKNKPEDEAIDEEGLPAYFCTLPIKKIVEEIKKVDIPAAISNTAGTFVCNNLVYGALNYIHKNNLKIKAGFIHIPYLPQQVIDKPDTPSMSLENMKKGILKAIEVSVLNYE